MENNQTYQHGPEDESVLTLQANHRSVYITGDPEKDKPLFVRRHKMSGWIIPNGVKEKIFRADFWGPYLIGHLNIDHALVNTWVERWREETHTFHILVGEVTITMQDVAMLLDLRIDGYPVTGLIGLNWPSYYERLLGIMPPPDAFVGASIKLGWLRDSFQENFPDALSDHVDRFDFKARAYILTLIGSVLFPNKSGTLVPLH